MNVCVWCVSVGVQVCGMYGNDFSVAVDEEYSKGSSKILRPAFQCSFEWASEL